jgi:hypothetical protein
MNTKKKPFIPSLMSFSTLLTSSDFRKESQPKVQNYTAGKQSSCGALWETQKPRRKEESSVTLIDQNISPYSLPVGDDGDRNEHEGGDGLHVGDEDRGGHAAGERRLDPQPWPRRCSPRLSNFT